jgi:hypothetical protein
MDDYDDLPPSEAARERRRDHDAEAHARAGMKTGLAKQFKQVLDTQVKRAKNAERKTADDAEEDDAEEEERVGRRPPAPHRKPER